MSELALYRKYRPNNFANLVGQDHVRQTLSNALLLNKVSHAYLFTGPRGTGKTSTARLLAKSLNCTQRIGGIEPCEECEMCKLINEDRLLDLIEIDAASHRGIDDARDLKEKIAFSPTQAKYKIYIIDEVHMLTTEAFNALLKTLEEPPEYAHFILATTEIHKVPETIISRCQRFDFKRIDNEILLERLAHIVESERVEAEKEALEMIARYADGGLRDAIGLLEQLTVAGKVLTANVRDILGITDSVFLNDLFKNLLAGETRKALQLIQKIYENGGNLHRFTEEFIAFSRLEMLKCVQNNAFLDSQKILEIIEIFQEQAGKFESEIPQLPLEIAIVKATAGKNLMPLQNQENQKKDFTPDKNLTPKNPFKEDHQTPAQSGRFSNLEDVKNQWARVLERIQIPPLRMAIKDGVPAKFSNGVLTLNFKTNFYLENVMKKEFLSEIEKIMQEVYGEKIILKGEIKNELTGAFSGAETNDSPTEDKSKNLKMAKALEIFGGELLEKE